MKKTALTLLFALTLTACAHTAGRAPSVTAETPRVDHGFRRTASPETYSDITFNAWDIAEAAKDLAPQPIRAHTLMIYMNGSDLESESGAATDDLREILRARADTSELNILIFTGGANRWQTPAIPAYECVISRVIDGELTHIAGIGQRNMGDAGTLASYIAFADTYFPAEQRTLILWDHGGGTIAGYGGDEHFNDGTLSLLELEYAFHMAGLAEKPLETLGFDACLMASVEMAVVGSRYARYLVASEATEPQDGWDYRVLRDLGRDPEMDGAAFGKKISDAYVRSGGFYPAEEYTLSVVRTDEAENVMGAMGKLTARLSDGLRTGYPGFTALANYRAGTKTFGTGSPVDADTDMVDLLDLAREHESLYPLESAALVDALNRAVVYNRYTSSGEPGGLSAYYIYGDRTDAEQALHVYENLAMSGAYTSYLHAFAAMRYSEDADVPPDSQRRGGTLFGRAVRMYAIAEPSGGTLFAVPATVGDAPADVIVYAPDSGEAVTLGYRRSHGYLVQKGYLPLDGERVELRDGESGGA